MRKRFKLKNKDKVAAELSKCRNQLITDYCFGDELIGGVKIRK
jgi:hypothetical protein